MPTPGMLLGQPRLSEVPPAEEWRRALRPHMAFFVLTCTYTYYNVIGTLYCVSGVPEVDAVGAPSPTGRSGD